MFEIVFIFNNNDRNSILYYALENSVGSKSKMNISVMIKVTLVYICGYHCVVFIVQGPVLIYRPRARVMLTMFDVPRYYSLNIHIFALFFPLSWEFCVICKYPHDFPNFNRNTMNGIRRL